MCVISKAGAACATAPSKPATSSCLRKDFVEFFLFIGAPMGAIIRKGGFGYPILVSIIFFVAFIMLTILCRKLAEGNFLSPFWASMVPCIVLIPVGAYLTRKGMNDSQMFSTDRLERFIRQMRNRSKKQKSAEAA